MLATDKNVKGKLWEASVKCRKAAQLAGERACVKAKAKARAKAKAAAKTKQTATAPACDNNDATTHIDVPAPGTPEPVASAAVAPEDAAIAAAPRAGDASPSPKVNGWLSEEKALELAERRGWKDRCTCTMSMVDTSDA